jgi:hypothetical protein
MESEAAGAHCGAIVTIITRIWRTSSSKSIYSSSTNQDSSCLSPIQVNSFLGACARRIRRVEFRSRASGSRQTLMFCLPVPESKTLPPWFYRTDHVAPSSNQIELPACSFGWWLMAGAGLFWEKSTAGWLLVAGLFWEKSTASWWLISQANRAGIDFLNGIWDEWHNRQSPKHTAACWPITRWICPVDLS